MERENVCYEEMKIMDDNNASRTRVQPKKNDRETQKIDRVHRSA